MKVLVFMSQFYQIDGSERLAVDLAIKLNKNGIRADILSMYSEELNGVKEAKEELLQKGVPSVLFLDMKIKPTFISAIPSIIRLWKLIN